MLRAAATVAPMVNAAFAAAGLLLLRLLCDLRLCARCLEQQPHVPERVAD